MCVYRAVYLMQYYILCVPCSVTSCVCTVLYIWCSVASCVCTVLYIWVQGLPGVGDRQVGVHDELEACWRLIEVEFIPAGLKTLESLPPDRC